MKQSWSLAVILGLLCSRYTGCECLVANETEDQLISYLMADYNMHARPTVEVVNVSLSFVLESVNELDEREQVLRIAGYINAYWNDSRLQWNPDDWQGIATISLPANMLWKPDFALMNAAGDIYNRAFYSSYYALEVASNGAISWFPHGDMPVRCILDLTFYPFDSQRCFLRFENWVYQSNLCRIYPQTDEISLDEFIGSGEWNVSKTSAVGFNKVYPGGASYSDVYFYLTLKRKTQFYMMNSVFPCAVMSVLACMVFALPAESQEKVALTITLLLSFVLLLVDVSNNLPKTSDYVPLLSRYLTFVTVMSALSLISTIYVIRISHRGTREVPSWVQRVVVQKLGRLLCVIPRRLGQRVLPRPTSSRMTLNIHTLSGTGSSLPSHIENSEKSKEYKTNEIMSEILTVLHEMQQQHTINRSLEETRHTWMTVGLVIDRILLCIFLLMTLIASVVIIGILPEHYCEECDLNKSIH